MRLRLIPGVAAALAATLACGGGAGGTGTDSDSGTGTDTDAGETTGEAIEFAEFFDLAEQTYCAWATRCGAFTAEADCRAVEFFDVLYQPGLLASGWFDSGDSGLAVQYLLASHAEGRLELDAAAATACLAYVEARGCLEPGTYAADEAEVAGRAACAAVFRGTMVANGPCLLTAECAPQDDARVVCGFDPTCSDACCIGGCRVIATIADGQPCNGPSRCAEGSFCATDPNTGAFSVCSKQKPPGAACQNFDECDAAGFCDFGAGTCVAYLGEGQSCDFGLCAPHLYCADATGNGSYRCVSYGKLGDACSDPWDDSCHELTAHCDGSTCAPLPGPGQQCTQYGACSPDAVCDWNTDRCVTFAGEGEPCGDGGRRCAGALYCDGWGAGEAHCRPPIVEQVCAVPRPDELPQGT